MRYSVEMRLVEPLKLRSDNSLQLQLPLPGFLIRGGLINAFLQYECPYSHYWCQEEDCQDADVCFVPSELLGEHGHISFGFIKCPSCKDNPEAFLIRTPSNWVNCKKCIREGTRGITAYQNILDTHQCTSCGSSATLQELNSWICRECRQLFPGTIFTYNTTGIGLNPDNISVEESYLFNFPVLIPGYEFVFFVETENTNFISFLQNSKDRFIEIGGGRSRGYGSLQILDIQEWKFEDKIESTYLLFITPAPLSTNTLDTFDRSEIETNLGKTELTNQWNSKSHSFTKRVSLAHPGTILLTKNAQTIGLQTITSHPNGLGGYINIHTLDKEA